MKVQHIIRAEVTRPQESAEIEPRVHRMPGIATVSTQTGSNGHMPLVQSNVSTGSGVK